MTAVATKPELTPILKLTRDIRTAATVLTDDEARFLVDDYYIMQDQRIRADGQIRAMQESGEPNMVINFFSEQSRTLENQVKSALNAYSNAIPLGQWARSICGVGPVIAAGLLAHIDITKPTAGHIWRFAGLDPSIKWGKGEKRPFNATLKTLCWKLGESFVKVQNNDADFYGKLYVETKEGLIAKNEAGEFAPAAAEKLEKFKISKTTDAYKAYSAGKLPPAHIHARAKRWAVKLFLSHYHAVGYWLAFETMPARPYAVEHLGHAHIISPPNLDLFDGLQDDWDAKMR